MNFVRNDSKMTSAWFGNRRHKPEPGKDISACRVDAKTSILSRIFRAFWSTPISHCTGSLSLETRAHDQKPAWPNIMSWIVKDPSSSRVNPMRIIWFCTLILEIHKWRQNYTCRVYNSHDRYLKEEWKSHYASGQQMLPHPFKAVHHGQTLLVRWPGLKASSNRRMHYKWQQDTWDSQLNPELYIPSFSSIYRYLLLLLRLASVGDILLAWCSEFSTDMVQRYAKRPMKWLTWMQSYADLQICWSLSKVCIQARPPTRENVLSQHRRRAWTCNYHRCCRYEHMSRRLGQYLSHKRFGKTVIGHKW